MTSTGKIARLPAAVREQLNQRLHDGEPAHTILPWLNGLAAVRAVLRRDFHSRPITPQNLSEWRRGGFALWRDEQASREAGGALPAQAPPKNLTALADDVLSLALDRMQRALALLSAAPESPEHLARLNALLPNVFHLARAQQRHEHLKLAAAKERRDQERFEWEKFDRQCAFRRQRILAPIVRYEKVKFFASGIPGDPNLARWLAAAAVLELEDLNPAPPLPEGYYDPPPHVVEKWPVCPRADEAAAHATAAAPEKDAAAPPLQPNPTQSKQIAPDPVASSRPARRRPPPPRPKAPPPTADVTATAPPQPTDVTWDTPPAQMTPAAAAFDRSPSAPSSAEPQSDAGAPPQSVANESPTAQATPASPGRPATTTFRLPAPSAQRIHPNRTRRRRVLPTTHSPPNPS